MSIRAKLDPLADQFCESTPTQEAIQVARTCMLTCAALDGGSSNRKLFSPTRGDLRYPDRHIVISAV